jgi:hypothetical protein
LNDIRPDDPLAVAVVDLIRRGNLDGLERLLRENPGLATSTIEGNRTLLHVAADWPGHFPSGAATVALLIRYGSDPNARCTGPNHTETPLHWAASSNDVAVLDALLDRGADIDAPGGVIGGGTPLADAVAFGQWVAARRLVERGARTTLWTAAALGLMAQVEKYFAMPTAPAADEVTNAFWCACHGGQPEAAEYLLRRGANINWVGYDQLTPLDAATRSGVGKLVAWLGTQGAKSAKDLQ